MYCQPEFPYQMQDYQQYAPQVVSYQAANIPTYNNGNISPFSPETPPDRPSPSFRIDDILLQNKVGNMHSYGAVYPSAPQHYGGFQDPHLSHGCMNQGNNNPAFLQLPPYLRIKPSLRTSSGRKCRKPRTVFSELQLMVLEREFSEHKYLSTPQRSKLADRLGLNQTQVKTWYQNRRMKWKKETNECDTKKLKQEDINNNVLEQIPRTQNDERTTCLS